MRASISQAQAAQQGNRTTDGKYTFGTHAEPDAVSLRPPDVKDIDEYLDFAVGEVLDGPLSRGVVSIEKRQRFLTEVGAAGTRGDQAFAHGMTDTIQRLYERRGPHDWISALEMCSRKRTNAKDREEWRLGLQHVPKNISEENLPSFERGRIYGALVLSGFEAGYNRV